MSTQYRDGSWSPIEPLPDALDTFKDALEAGTAKCMVVGSEEEIAKAQDESATAKDIEELKRRILMLEAKRGLSLIHIPTKEQCASILTETTGNSANNGTEKE